MTSRFDGLTYADAAAHCRARAAQAASPVKATRLVRQAEKIELRERAIQHGTTAGLRDGRTMARADVPDNPAAPAQFKSVADHWRLGYATALHKAICARECDALLVAA